MHHLFVVHSPITRFVAEAAAAREHLAPERVVLLLARGAESGAPPARRTPISYGDVPDSPRSLREALACRLAVRRLDTLLADAVGGDPFHLYVPQTMERWIQIARSHPACAGFSLLEEGLYSYCTPAEIARTLPPMRHRRWDRIGYGGRVRAASFFEPGHTRAYAVTDEAFPGFPHRTVLPDAIPPAPHALAGGIDDVLVLDGLASQRRLRLDGLLDALERLCDTLRERGVARLHYKLHPAQAGTPEAAAIERALGGAGPALETLPLPPGLALESVARARPDSRWYVNLSSVGLYAALFGCSVESFARWIAEREPAFAEHVARTPQAFVRRVRFL
jgi:hypothetical protein